MATTPTMAHWIELLGLKTTIDDLLAGALKLNDAREAVLAKRAVYPSVSQDYIKIIGLVEDFLDELDGVLSKQKEAVDAFNETVEEVALEDVPMALSFYFNYENGKLLSEDDQDELNKKQEGFADLMQDFADEMEDIQREMEDANDELENLQTEIESIQEEQESLAEEAEDEVETAGEELNNAGNDLNDADQELEAAQDNS